MILFICNTFIFGFGYGNMLSLCLFFYVIVVFFTIWNVKIWFLNIAFWKSSFQLCLLVRSQKGTPSMYIPSSSFFCFHLYLINFLSLSSTLHLFLLLCRCHTFECSSTFSFSFNSPSLFALLFTFCLNKNEKLGACGGLLCPFCLSLPLR